MHEMKKGATSLPASQEAQQIVSTHDSQHKGYTASSISRCAKTSTEAGTQSSAHSRLRPPERRSRRTKNVNKIAYLSVTRGVKNVARGLIAGPWIEQSTRAVVAATCGDQEGEDCT